MSQTHGVVGRHFMTNIPDTPDLVGIAREAEVEILAAQAIEASELTAGDAEIGYYEAELKSLRDAAATLHEDELVD